MLAQLEASSVRAFAELSRELARNGAPEPLVVAARASANDERRHARAISALARRFGAAVPRVRTRATPRRSLAAMAEENAVEGCVRETFGALLAAWQAARAKDPEVRAAMAAIAVDELRHAALAWEIAAWAEARLSPAKRRRVARARRRAAARLVAAAARPEPRRVRALAGLPDANEATRLARSLAERLLLAG
jgi:hypothetical protein